MAEKSYAGKIQNTGSQKVESLYGGTSKKGNGTVKSGTDLRTGSTGKR